MAHLAQAASAPQTWKVTLAYDGTDYFGWQVQPGKPTIQGELQAALGRVAGESPLPQGSGRTDAGVHALAQVASVALHAPIPPDNLRRALNRTLPAAIRVLETKTVRSTFHARHDARAKTYEYRVLRADDCPPFLSRYVHFCRWPLALEALNAAAQVFLGEYDFTSFAATDPDLTTRAAPHGEPAAPAVPLTAVRSVFLSTWERRACDAGELWVYRVRGNGFLHHMVRNLVGTMLDVGRGFLPVAALPGILAARQRSAAGPTAPARGLFLHSVEYDTVDESPA